MLNDKKRLEDSNHLQSGFSLKINPLTQKPFYFPIQSWEYFVKTSEKPPAKFDKNK